MTSERHPPRLAATAAAFAVLAAVASISAPSPAAAAGYVPGPCISNAGPGPHPFVDVAGGAFYADAVAWMFSNGITRGVTPDRFGPDRPVTRAEFAAMLHRMACEPVAAGVAAFADLVPGAFYRAAVDWMVGENITMGKTATSFGPDDPMTRGELATFLYRFVDEPTGAPVAGFVDNDPASFHAAAVDWLVFRSITRGTSAITFSPGRTITRGEVATFLYRLNTIGDVALVLRPVLTGLASPTSTALDPTTGDLYIAEQAGLVKRVPSGSGGVPDFSAITTVLDVDAGDAVLSGGERGLLGVAVSPDGTRIHVGYTSTPAGASVIAEYALAGGVVDPGSARTLLTVAQPESNHNGGHLAFGPDGFLYAGFGDGGGGNDPHGVVGNGQDTSTLLGAILRLDVSSTSVGKAYAIPGDNPFASSAGADEIFLYGVRNPWKFSFDTVTGDLWVADVGQGAREEITRLPAGLGGGNGANLGWRLREGTIATPGVGGPEPAGHIGPIHEYDHSSGSCSITGGHVYRGASIPALDGVYVYADFCSAQLWGWRDAHGVEAVSFGVDVPGGAPSTFAEDANGELYVLSLGGTMARLDRAVG